MAPPKRGEKKTRGQIRNGLVAIMSSRLRRFLLAIATNRMVHVECNSGKKASFTTVPHDRHRAGVGYYSTGVLEQRPLMSTDAVLD